MRKIYKPLILLTTIMSLSFSVEASEPAQKVNLSKNSENTPTSIGSEQFTRETPEDVLDELSNYAYQCFNWKGSKFKKKWN